MTIPNAMTPIGDVLRDATVRGVVVISEAGSQFAVIPLDDDLVDYLLERSPRFAEACRQIRQRMREGRFHTHESVRQLLTDE